jgi:Flp pilus assembly pilin Flp
MEQFLRTLWHDESGQDMSEYALLVALVGIGLITITLVFRDSIGQVFETTSDALDGAPAGEFTPGG